MEKINAVITGVGGYVPDYILTNDEISKMVDTTDEWIMGRIGIKERRINSKTICKNFTNHFALFLILLTQNEMSI